MRDAVYVCVLGGKGGVQGEQDVMLSLKQHRVLASIIAARMDFCNSVLKHSKAILSS